MGGCLGVGVCLTCLVWPLTERQKQTERTAIAIDKGIDIWHTAHKIQKKTIILTTRLHQTRHEWRSIRLALQLTNKKKAMQAMMAHSLSNYTRIPTDVYAVVEKKRKIKVEPSNMGNYDVITADANSTTANLYDYTSAPAYGKLDSSHNIQNETMGTDKVCGPNKCTEILYFGRIKYWEHRSVNVATCLAVLITAIIAEVVAVAMAFVLIAGIRSDLTAALKDSSSSPGSSSEKSNVYHHQFGTSTKPVTY